MPGYSERQMDDMNMMENRKSLNMKEMHKDPMDVKMMKVDGMKEKMKNEGEKHTPMGMYC